MTNKEVRISSAEAPPTNDPGRWERGKDPWHADAFPDAFKSRAPNQGVRGEGWFELDVYGQAIGFVPDGSEI